MEEQEKKFKFYWEKTILDLKEDWNKFIDIILTLV